MTSTMGTRASVTWILTDLGTRKPSRGQGYATKVREYGLALLRISSIHPPSAAVDPDPVPSNEYALFNLNISNDCSG